MRFGGITVLDGLGQASALVTSGLTRAERRLPIELPVGSHLFELLSCLPEPLRLTDFAGCARELGPPEVEPPLGPVGAFLGPPIRHQAAGLATSTQRTRRATPG